MRFAVYALCFFWLGWSARASQDPVGLRSADENVVRAQRLHDPEVFFEFLHPQLIGFEADGLFARDYSTLGEAERRDGLTGKWSSLKHYDVIPTTSVYRVVGDTGLVLGFLEEQSERAGYPRKSREVRVMRVYTKETGDWRLLAFHFSEAAPPLVIR